VATVRARVSNISGSGFRNGIALDANVTHTVVIRKPEFELTTENMLEWVHAGTNEHLRIRQVRPVGRTSTDPREQFIMMLCESQGLVDAFDGVVSAVINGPTEINFGETGVYSVTGTYADASTKDITDQVTWEYAKPLPDGVTFANNILTNNSTSTENIAFSLDACLTNGIAIDALSIELLNQYVPDYNQPIEPVNGLDGASGVYMSLDDIIMNTNDLIVEMDFMPHTTTGIQYHGVAYQGVYLGNQQSSGNWFFGMGNGFTSPGMTFRRAKLTLNTITREQFVDDVGVGTVTNYTLNSTQPHQLWRAITSPAGTPYVNCPYAIMYAFRVWKAGVLIHQLLGVGTGQTLYNATAPAPSNCFWDTVAQRYYEPTGGVLSLVGV
jgi:hypothetical protein